MGLLGFNVGFRRKTPSPEQHFHLDSILTGAKDNSPTPPSPHTPSPPWTYFLHPYTLHPKSSTLRPALNPNPKPETLNPEPLLSSIRPLLAVVSLCSVQRRLRTTRHSRSKAQNQELRPLNSKTPIPPPPTPPPPLNPEPKPFNPKSHSPIPY